MTSTLSWPQGRLVCSLDIEMAPDPAAVRIAGHRGDIRAALARITAVCLLTARENADGSWTDIKLHTFDDEDEFDLLMALDLELQRLIDGDPILLSFNGLRHDLGAIRRRLAHHWLFGLDGLSSLADVEHHDLMLRMTRGWRDSWPSLVDACAGLGIPILGATGKVDVVEKCQSDVCAVFLLALYEMAIERGREDVLVAGWKALSKHILRPGAKLPHLAALTRHPKLDTAIPR